MKLAFLSIAVFGSISVACGPTSPTAEPSRRPPLTGTVADARGGGVAATLLITDLATKKELGLVSTDPRGRFHFETDATEVAIAVTTSDGFAFVERVQLPTDSLQIVTDRRCEQVVGTLTPADPAVTTAGSVFQFGRFSDFIGDSFPIVADHAGHLRGCLPAARYFATSDLLVASGGVLLELPGDRVDVVVSTNQIARAAPTAAFAWEALTLPDFAASVAAARVVGLGESNHGTGDYTAERATIAAALQPHGFHLILIEGAFAETLAVNAYVQGEDIDVRAAVAGIGFWMWDTEEFITVLERMRSDNAARRIEERVHVLGIDVQTAAAAIDCVLATAGSRLDADVAEALRGLTPDNAQGYAGVDATMRERIDRQLDEIPLVPGAGLEPNRAALCARALRGRLEIAKTTRRYDDDIVRDRWMGEMVLAVLESMPRSRATIWAHLGHVARQYAIGKAPAGAHLARSLGDEYRAYALIAQRGGARAWDRKLEVGVVAQELPEAPSWSIEKAGGFLDDAKRLYVNLDGQPAPVVEWLRGLRYLREFGAVHYDEENRWTVWDTFRSVDGYVVFGRVAPSTPTKTGIRVASPPQ